MSSSRSLPSRRSFGSILLGVWVVLPNSISEADDSAAKPPKDQPLSVLAPYVGYEWHVDAKWASGQPLRARNVYEWGMGKKPVRVRTYVQGPKGEYQRYETYYCHDAKTGTIRSWGLNAAGARSEGMVRVEGRRLHFEGEPTAGEPPLFQWIERLDEMRFRWRAEVEKDGKRVRLIDAVYLRRPIGSQRSAPLAKDFGSGPLKIIVREVGGKTAYEIDGKRLSLEEVEKGMRKRIEARTREDRASGRKPKTAENGSPLTSLEVHVRSSRDVPYASVTKVLEVCTRLGVYRVGISQLPSKTKTEP